MKDSGGVLRDLPVKTISGIGVEYPETDESARADPAQGALPGQPMVKISITCVFDTTAAQASSTTGNAPAFSGSHTVLSALNGLMTPLTFGYYRGMRQYWVTGEPVFGIASSAANGVLVRNYQVNGDECSADLILYPGSAVPSWGTSQLA